MSAPEVDIAVLKRDVAEIRSDIERSERVQDERRKLDDARHEAVMLQLQQLQLTIASGRSFAQGAKFTAGVVWALVGGAIAYAVTWLFQGGMKG